MRLFNKIVVAAVIAVACAVFVACLGQSRLEKIVKAMNEECPLSMGSIGEITSVEIVDGNALCNLMIDEQYMNIQALKDNVEVLRQNILTSFMNPSKEMADLITELKRSDAGLIYKYTGKQTGNSFQVVLSAEDIRNASKADPDNSDPMERMQAEINSSNLQCPMSMDIGITITSLELEEEYVVYNITVDEDLVNMLELKANSSQMEQVFRTNLLSQQDAVSTNFVKLCREVKRNMLYRFKGSASGEILEIKVDILGH